jgi:serine/threonine protein kinase
MASRLAEVSAALQGRYTIERELGRGGMATVYLAQDRKHDRRVALKLLRPELSAALGPERFLREIHIAASLSHPHILALHGAMRSAEGIGRARRSIVRS